MMNKFPLKQYNYLTSSQISLWSVLFVVIFSVFVMTSIFILVNNEIDEFIIISPEDFMLDSHMHLRSDLIITQNLVFEIFVIASCFTAILLLIDLRTMVPLWKKIVYSVKTYYLLIKEYIEFQQIKFIEFITGQVIILSIAIFYIFFLFVYWNNRKANFSILSPENIAWDSYVLIPNDLAISSDLMIKIIVMAICFSITLLLIDLKTIWGPLQEVLPNSSISIKALELLVLIWFVEYAQQNGMRTTLGTNPLQFLSSETLAWIKELIEADPLFITMLLLFIKNVLMISITICIYLITNTYDFSRFARLVIKFFLFIISFIITTLTIGSALFLAFKCYSSYTWSDAPTGILLTIGGFFIIWRKLSWEEVVQNLNSEITKYVNKSSYKDDIIIKEFTAYLKQQFIMNYEKLYKVFGEEGYYPGLSFINEQIKLLHYQFHSSLQSKIEIVENISQSSSWVPYIVVGALAVIIILAGGYCLYKYLYPDTPPAPILKLPRTNKNASDEQILINPSMQQINGDICQNLGHEHVLVLQKFHKDITNGIERVRCNAVDRVEQFNRVYNNYFTPIWKNSNYDPDNATAYIITNKFDNEWDKKVLISLVTKAHKFIQQQPIQEQRRFAKRIVSNVRYMQIYEDKFRREILGATTVDVAEFSANNWNMHLHYACTVPDTPEYIYESYRLFNDFIFNSNFTRNSGFTFFEIKNWTFYRQASAISEARPQFWLHPNTLLSLRNHNVGIKGTWDPILKRFSYITEENYLPNTLPNYNFDLSYFE